MHRAEKEIKDRQEIITIMQKASICRVAFIDGDYPYIIPVNFVLHDNNLYFHSSMEGKKIDVLRKNNKVCFEIDIDTEIIKNRELCLWGMQYLSVIGFGQAFLIEKPSEKRKALDLLMEKFAGRGSFSYAEEALRKVLIINIKIEKISGKKSYIS